MGKFKLKPLPIAFFLTTYRSELTETAEDLTTEKVATVVDISVHCTTPERRFCSMTTCDLR